MAFQVLEMSIELVRELTPLMARIRQRDKSLADQLTRAANSIALNLGESRLADPGNRRARLHSAAGSASETQVAVRLAVAWRIISERDAANALGLLRRIVAILWRLTRG